VLITEFTDVIPETCPQGSVLNSNKRNTAVDEAYDYITNEDSVEKSSRCLMSVKSELRHDNERTANTRT